MPSENEGNHEGFGKTFADPKVNWMFETEPDPRSGGRRMYWPRGKVLGGSSSINGMIYIRGQHEDFDHWRQLGNPGWSSTNVLPYFKRSESQERGGDDTHPICDAFIEAAVELGFPRNNDFNGKVQEGVGYQQTTTRNGRRWSTAVGYLKPAMKRPNLRVINRALTERVIFEGKRAVGVAFQEAGVTRSIRARREVILCGGAIGSPHILLLSGVGPAEHLREHGIEVVCHLAGVGQSLQDHYSGAVKLRCNRKITLNDVMKSNVRKLGVGLDYILRRRGPLTMGVEPVALFARTRSEFASPDVKFTISPFSADNPAKGLHDFSGFTLIGYQLRPDSRGELKLRSADPRDTPAMFPNYLSAENDQRTIVDSLKLCREFLATDYLHRFVESEYLPGPDVQSDEDLLEYARKTGGTTFHQTSTCRMGSDPLAVVDAELRVHGLEGLRVVDASIMPTVASGNTNAPTIMIAEKASDMIRGRAPLAAAA